MGISSYLSNFALGITPEGILRATYGGTGTTTGAGTVSSSPTITSIVYTGDDTATNIAGGDTVTLNGTNFNTGVIVLVATTQVSQVTRVSATQLTFLAPANATGSYILYVVNPDGSSAISVPGLQYSGVPAWTTASGSLGSSNQNTSFTTTVAATGDAPVSYAIVSGALPAGVTLNSSTGVISGTTPSVASSTTYTFTIRATDAQNQDTNRVFSLTVYPITYSDTPAANNINEGSVLTLNVTGEGITNGTYYWTVNTNAGDFVTSSGSFTITSNVGSFTVTPTADMTTEGAETFTVSIRSDSTSGTVLATSTSITINDASTTPSVPTVIGQAWGGGYYAGQISTSANNVATHYLIVAPYSTEVAGRWGYNGAYDGSRIDGPGNTATLVAAGFPAAQYCDNLTTGGYTDWYLPARDEVDVLYYNLKPKQDLNQTGYGYNAYSVSPQTPNTYYTSATPAQTTAVAFQFGGEEAFWPRAGTADYTYWSSTGMWNNTDAFAQQFGSGQQQAWNRGNTDNRIRAVRRIPV